MLGDSGILLDPEFQTQRKSWFAKFLIGFRALKKDKLI